MVCKSHRIVCAESDLRVLLSWGPSSSRILLMTFMPASCSPESELLFFMMSTTSPIFSRQLFLPCTFGLLNTAVNSNKKHLLRGRKCTSTCSEHYFYPMNHLTKKLDETDKKLLDVAVFCLPPGPKTNFATLVKGRWLKKTYQP